MNEKFYENMILNHKMCYNINTERENKNRMRQHPVVYNLVA